MIGHQRAHMARHYLLSHEVARRLSSKDSCNSPDNEDRSDQRRSDQYPSPAKNHRFWFRFAFATQSRSQTSFESCGRPKSESSVTYSRPQTPNPLGGLRACVAILKVLFDF